MANLPNLIPVLQKSKILFYIERKKDDFRPSYVIISKYKLNKKNSEIKTKQKLAELDNKWQTIKKTLPKQLTK